MLTEAQIQWYQRQILLREVGGAGQEKLLGVSLATMGGGSPSLDACVAFLVAGGTRVELYPEAVFEEGAPPRLLPRRLGGFLHGVTLDSDAFHPEAAFDELVALTGTFEAFNPALGEEAEGIGDITPAPVCVLARGAVALVVGGDGFVFRTRQGCPRCFESLAAALSPQKRPELAPMVGAMAALAVQRHLLGLGDDPLVGLRWDGERLVAIEAERCKEHAS